MTLKLNYVATSDRGLVRGNNEDSAYAGPHLLLLADGMGGHAAGEVASQLMVEHMEHLDQDPGDADMLALLGAAADDANASIADSIREHPEQDGMGTTLTALMFNGTDFGMIHAGDSRGYLLRGDTLVQITVDDTFVQSLVEQGKLDPEDVSSHPQKSLILKAYTGRPVQPYLEQFAAEPGDRYLLCSDGLSDPVTSTTIQSALAEGSPEEAAQRLTELALRSGGPDNITIVIADVVDTAADDAPRLPTTPAIAGALALEQKDETHPNTAAGRAAALNRKPQVIPPNQNSSDDTGAPESGDDDEESHTRKPRIKGRAFWITLVTLLLIIILALLAIWFAMSKIDDRFYVTLNDNDEFVVEHGVDFEVFGKPLHQPIQQTCINSKNELKFVDVGELPKDCQVFSLSDLPKSAHSAAMDLPGGSFEEVSQQMHRLADEALPVCVSDKPEDEKRSTPNDCREVK